MKTKNEADKTTRGTIHDYLEMTLDYSISQKVEFMNDIFYKKSNIINISKESL